VQRPGFIWNSEATHGRVHDQRRNPDLPQGLGRRPASRSANRSEFYRAVPSGPFYNFDQPGVTASEAIIANWWRQGMMGSAKGQYDCVSAFIREDFSDDLKKITVPVLAMNGEGDQVVPCATSGPRAVELVRNGTLKTYPGFPHGMPTTHADTINNDLLTFIQS
jgi:non-heme chloroperoxidase